MTPDREAQRVAALRTYDVLGSEPERPYDEITELAAQVAQCPASIISFMDDSHLWPKAHHGMPPNRAPLPREMFMCSTAAAGADLLIIEDLTKDSRFAHLPVGQRAAPSSFLLRHAADQPTGPQPRQFVRGRL